MEPLVIDGSQGEGGGQILRTSLAPSMITGRPAVIEAFGVARFAVSKDTVTVEPTPGRSANAKAAR